MYLKSQINLQLKKAGFEPKPLELSYFNYLQNIKKRNFLAIALLLPKVAM